MQTNRGVARRDCRCAQARTRFTPLQRFAKAKLCLSIKAFYALRIFSRLHGGVRIARRVGWVERSDTHHATRRFIDGFRKGSTHPTRWRMTWSAHVRFAHSPWASLDSIFGDDADNDRAPKGEQNIGHRIGDSK